MKKTSETAIAVRRIFCLENFDLQWQAIADSEPIHSRNRSVAYSGLSHKFEF